MSLFADRRTKKFTPDSPVFISTRSLYPEYRIDRILTAFSLLLKQIPGAVLKITGTGSEESALKKQAATLGISGSVVFTGRLAQKKLLEELKQSDIYISVIETEGMSSSLIEAAACGLLPLVTRMPASSEIISDGKNGILLTDTSPEALCGKMLSAAAGFSEMEPALLANREEVIRRYDREKNLDIFLEKYEELIRAVQTR
jgi:glycosyltransferase involved in cell wall biosynthesis